MAISTQFENVGAGYPAFGGAAFGGFGSGGILEGLLLGSLLGNRRGGLFGNDGCGDGGSLLADAVAAKTVALQDTADLKRDVAAVNTTVEALGNEIQNAFSIQNLGIQSQFNQVDSALATISKEAAVAALEAKIATLQATNEIKTDITALSTKTDAQTCEILRAINADGDATRALINVNTVNALRDELLETRRRSDAREIEINVTQTNQQLQNQMQAQFQSQNSQFGLLLQGLTDQIAKQNQGIVAIGSTLTGTAQTASNANNRVN